MKRVILVLGMHRAGTSAITRGLLALGVPLGGRLMPERDDNPTGFWEDADIVNLNDRVLAELGHDWHSLGWIADEQFSTNKLDTLREEAAALLADRLHERVVWAFKDPRNARLLPFWESVFQKINVDYSCILCIRNPLSIAGSLAARDHFSFEKCLLLWALHMGRSAAAAARLTSVVVDYDRLVDNPPRELKRMARALSLPPPSGEALKSYQQQFLDTALRHSRHDLATLQADARLAPILAEFHSMLRSAAESRRPDKSRLAELDRRLAAFAPMFNYLQSLQLTAGPDHSGELQQVLATALIELSRESGSRIHPAAPSTPNETVSKENSAWLVQTNAFVRSLAVIAVQGMQLRAADEESANARSSLSAQTVRIAEFENRISDLKAGLTDLQARLRQLLAERPPRMTNPVARYALRAWRAVRRPWFEMTMRPVNDLTQDQDGWTAVGDDPQFQLQPARTRFPTRWVRIRIDLKVTEPTLFRAVLYFDLGSGYNEVDRITLPAPADGHIAVVARLPDAVAGLRFDPLNLPGRFKIGAIAVQEISTFEAAMRLAFRVLRRSVRRPRDVITVARKAWRLFRSSGTSILRALPLAAINIPEASSYNHWIANYDRLTAADRDAIRRRISSFATEPKFSVLMPVYNTDLRWLRAAIDSVRAQIYTGWELCISDDASTRSDVRDELRRYAEHDPRIRLNFRSTNGNISANSNDALSLASGDFIVLLDADDVLPEHALYWVAAEIDAHPDADLIFSDEDKIDADGRRFDPYFKSDWNPALMLSQNAFCHLGVYRRALVEKVGGFRIGFEGSQDHDLALRCSRATEAKRIFHIPRILYHWRAIETSTAADGAAKPYAWDAGRRAIEEHLTHLDISAEVGHAEFAPNFYQVQYPLPPPHPRVSILIPTTGEPRFLKPCLDSIFGRTTYPNFEVLLLVSDKHRAVASRAAALHSPGNETRVRVLTHPDRPFNFAWVNNWGASQASGEILCLLNDDTEVVTSDWLEKLVARLSLERVGAVGPMLYFPDGRIQHAGVILGIGGVAVHAFNGMRRGSQGYSGRACLEQDLSCVTAGCMIIRKEAFQSVGGFDEDFAVAFNDVDLCIRLRAAGWRIVWTPAVELIHHESVSVGKHSSAKRAAQFAEEVNNMRKRWAAVLEADPNYNVNLSLQEPFELAFPPRLAG